MNFWPSAKRLLGQLRPERLWLVLVLMLAVVSVTFSVIGPRLLGEGTNLIFAGVVSKQLPAGVSQDQVIAQLRAAGQTQQADMLSAMTLTPGRGDRLRRAGQRAAVGAGAVRAGVGFSWMQAYILNGVVQRTVFRLRERIEAKINRLPLRYFDSIQRGELLSRVTNDVDNISQSLQQSISQAVTSLLTVLGVLVMMFILSPTLALIALVTVPLTLVTTAVIAKRSQKLFVAQWKHTGELNGQIEETYTGHALVKVFGRQREVEERFRQKNAELYEASFGAQFMSGLIMPAMTFIGNLVYVGIAVVGGLQVAAGAMQLGDVQAFIQYSRQFTQPLAQLGSMANLLQSGVASAERVFELLDDGRSSRRILSPAVAPNGGPGPAGVRERVVLLLAGQAADHGPEPGGRAGADRGDRGPDRGGQDHPGEPDDALLRARRRADHARRRGRHRDDPRRAALADGHGAAGHLAVRRDHPGQHRLRPARRFGGRDPGGRAGDVRGPVRPVPAGGLRHRARGRGRQRLRGREAAADDRPGVPGPAVGADPGRGDELGGHPHRGAGAEGDERAAVRPDVVSSSRTGSPPSATPTSSW